METHFTWKVKFLSNKYEIYQYENRTGEIINKAFSRSASGNLNGKKLLFNIKGFFRQETRILDAETESVIADVVISSWKSRATITYNNKEFTWQHDNFWNTKWSISDVTGTIVKYHSSGTGGEILAYTNDEVLILAGLFVKNYFKQRAAAAAAAT
jgi:hypothetical protein